MKSVSRVEKTMPPTTTTPSAARDSPPAPSPRAIGRIPTTVEIATFVGSFGLFFTLFLIFCRFVPVIAIAEVKGVIDVEKSRTTADKNSTSEEAA
jgi:hypothetical protein